MERLTADLLLEIFSCLPVKSILRCRCVSKAWKSLIFDDRHHKKLPAAMTGLFYIHDFPRTTKFTRISRSSYGDSDATDTDFTFIPSHHRLSILDLVNGLVLCSVLEQGNTKCYYVVCNPATRRWARLPDPEEGLISQFLGFDPQLSPHYRIFRYYRRRRTTKFKIFRSETDDWVDGPETEDEPVGCVLLNGIFHMMYASASACLVHNSLTGVDLDGKVCPRRIELPYLVPDSWVHLLGTSGGLLHYAAKSEEEMLLVWAQEDHHDSSQWVLKHSVTFGAIMEKLLELHSFADRPYRLANELGLETFHPDVDVIFLTLGGRLLSYHWTSANLEVICSLRGKIQANFRSYSPCYLEDLDL